jgi:hypothetical protein
MQWCTNTGFLHRESVTCYEGHVATFEFLLSLHNQLVDREEIQQAPEQ